MAKSPELSIIVPVYNSAQTLAPCLHALLDADGPSREIVVVDDASDDESDKIAQMPGVRLIKLESNGGPARARNEGVKRARSTTIVFIDSDVVIHSDALQRILPFFDENPEYCAVFGSYDAEPFAGTPVSLYRNLLHHFTHQCGQREAETFWTGIGAIKRSAFDHVGGFRDDAAVLEDVDLGLRLRDAGFRIALDKYLLGAHLKRWTLLSMMKTDVFDRALPWSKLAFERGGLGRQLNTTYGQRLSVFCACLTVILSVVSLGIPWAALLAAVSFLTFMALNVSLFRFFMRRHGIGFAAATVPLHLVHHLCAATGFALAALEVLRISGKYIAARAYRAKYRL